MFCHPGLGGWGIQHFRVQHFICTLLWRISNKHSLISGKTPLLPIFSQEYYTAGLPEKRYHRGLNKQDLGLFWYESQHGFSEKSKRRILGNFCNIVRCPQGHRGLRPVLVRVLLCKLGFCWSNEWRNVFFLKSWDIMLIYSSDICQLMLILYSG